MFLNSEGSLNESIENNVLYPLFSLVYVFEQGLLKSFLTSVEITELEIAY